MSHSDFARRVNVARLAIASTVALATFVGCNVPTSVPIVDSHWVVPSRTTTIAVSSLLPAGVTILADSSAFQVSATGASFSRSLGQDCPECAAANGLVIPKPAFVASASTSSTFALDVASATLASGTLQVVVSNGFNFDPLRPSATARGYAVIVVSNDGRQIGRDSVSGNSVALPAAGSLTRSIPLSGLITGSAPVVVTFTLSSPQGDPVQINTARTITATATPLALRVPSVAVVVNRRQVSSTSSIDLASVDSAVTRRVQSGALLLGVTNPFAVGGTLAVTLTPSGGAAITRSVVLTAGSSSPRLDFTGGELRSLLGHAVTLTFSGPVTGTTGSVTVSPRQSVVVTSRLDLALQVGG